MSTIPTLIFLLAVVFCNLSLAQTDRQKTDHLIYSAPIEEFDGAHADSRYSGLNFTTDGCSKVPDAPLGFKFGRSCRRHDFGTRNIKAQNRANEQPWVDDVFLNDMRNECRRSSEARTRRSSTKALESLAKFDVVQLIDLLSTDRTYCRSLGGWYAEFWDPETGEAITAVGSAIGKVAPATLPDDCESGGNTTSSGTEAAIWLGSFAVKEVCEVVAMSYFVGVRLWAVKKGFNLFDPADGNGYLNETTVTAAATTAATDTATSVVVGTEIAMSVVANASNTATDAVAEAPIETSAVTNASNSVAAPGPTAS